VRTTESDLEMVRQHLRQAQYGEQARLPPERELAEILGITRNRLRGSLRKLAAEGVIWRHVGRGTYFGNKPSTETTVNELAQLTNPREMMEARFALEPEIARLAALHATLRDFTRMEECLERMSQMDDFAAWSAWDVQLHRALAEATSNKLLLAMFDALQLTRQKEIWGKLHLDRQTSSRRQDAAREHLAFVTAVRDRDPQKAAGLMRQHLNSVQEAFLGGRAAAA